jgi:hypothetical protein
MGPERFAVALEVGVLQRVPMPRVHARLEGHGTCSRELSRETESRLIVT